MNRVPPLEDIARVYRDAIERGSPPAIAVANHYSRPYSTAARWISKARQAALLPPTVGGRARGHNGEHYPTGARLNTGARSFTVCAKCLERWPCGRA